MDFMFMMNEVMEDMFDMFCSYYKGYNISKGNLSTFKLIKKVSKEFIQQRRSEGEKDNIIIDNCKKNLDTFIETYRHTPKKIKSYSKEEQHTLFVSFNSYIFTLIELKGIEDDEFNGFMIIKRVGGVCITFMMSDFPYICSGCYKLSDDKMKKCSGCKTKSIYYCSRECQKENWKEHKKNCESAK